MVDSLTNKSGKCGRKLPPQVDHGNLDIQKYPSPNENQGKVQINISENPYLLDMQLSCLKKGEFKNQSLRQTGLSYE